jgi:HemY protein
MIRLIGILIAIGLVAAGAVWIADRHGELVFTVDAWEVRMSAAVAIVLALAVTLAAIALSRLLVALVLSPGAIGAWLNARRMRRGNDAVTQGLLAIAAGDPERARLEADRARGLLGTHPLALLLQSQTALADGNPDAQRQIYRAMRRHPQTELLGLRGLFLLAARENEQAQALAFAEQAHALHPRLPWAANAVFDLRAAHRHWAEALKALDDNVRYKLIDNDTARRRRAVLLTAQALDADARGEDALDLATAALSLDAGLAPAAVLAARKLAAAGKLWRAQGVVEACWAQAPHPDLAAVYAAMKPEESDADRVRRLVGLARLNRDHFESRLLEAEEAVLTKDWAEARRLLSPLADDRATARVCALMAEIEEGETGDASAAHAWLARAARAPRDAQWRCSHCGMTETEWSAVCVHCGNFDTLRWGESAPKVEFAPAPRVAVPRKIPVETPAIVTLPRPPDDPGPGGGEF